MRIIKKIARWVLRKELESLETEMQDLRNHLNKKYIELMQSERKLEDWQNKANLNKGAILSQSAVKSIIDCLPNPNEVAAGRVECKSTHFSYVISGGRKISHTVSLEKFHSIGDVVHAQVKIHDLKISIMLPLRKECIRYNMLGVNTEVDTYYWDFNFSNLKIISDDSFNIISEFVVAQKNVLTGDI